LSGTSRSGVPPIAAKARSWASIQSGSVCVQLARAKVKLDAPGTATKIWGHADFALFGMPTERCRAACLRLVRRGRRRRGGGKYPLPRASDASAPVIQADQLTRKSIERDRRAGDQIRGDLGIACRRGDAGMAEERLVINDPNVNARF